MHVHVMPDDLFQGCLGLGAANIAYALIAAFSTLLSADCNQTESDAIAVQNCRMKWGVWSRHLHDNIWYIYKVATEANTRVVRFVQPPFTQVEYILWYISIYHRAWTHNSCYHSIAMSLIMERTTNLCKLEFGAWQFLERLNDLQLIHFFWFGKYLADDQDIVQDLYIKGHGFISGLALDTGQRHWK